MGDKVFVFGSNKAGRHGKGAAKYAYEEKGAIYGQGEGLQGQSYAIPTKDKDLRRLSIGDIRLSVNRFLAFAASRPDLIFEVTPIGCGLAGFKPSQIGPLFNPCPSNVRLPDAFL